VLAAGRELTRAVEQYSGLDNAARANAQLSELQANKAYKAAQRDLKKVEAAEKQHAAGKLDAARESAQALLAKWDAQADPELLERAKALQ